jgi:glucosyl-dolichyl phosphate glucuronosyltransferase
MDATVVVCTRNRRASLLRLLESLRHQKSDASWSVLVVDNASEDGTAEAARELASDFPVPLRVAHEPRPGLSCARNCALEHASGDVLVWTDDDATCDPRWLDGHLAAYSDPHCVGAGGRVRVVLPPGVPEGLASFLRDRRGGPAAPYDFGDQPRDIVPGGRIATPFGANMSMRRQPARELGGFREDLGWSGAGGVPGEETEFFARALRAGGRLRYVPDAVVFHHIPPERASVDYLCAWYRRSGQGRALSLRPLPSRTWLRLAGRNLGRLVRYTVLMWFVPRESVEWIKCLGRREKSLGVLSALVRR